MACRHLAGGRHRRRLRGRLGAANPAERLESAGERLRAEPQLVELPHRFSLFGLTRLPPARLHVLEALAACRDVHLFLLHPSPALWDAVATTEREPAVRRHEDPTVELASNRLLASWGQDAREMQLVLTGGDAASHHHPAAMAATPAEYRRRVSANLLRRFWADTSRE